MHGMPSVLSELTAGFNNRFSDQFRVFGRRRDGVRVAAPRLLESLLESLNLALRVYKLLSARKKRMAIRADIELQSLDRGAGGKRISTGACDMSVVELWM